MTTAKRKPITENAFLLKKLESWKETKKNSPDHKFTDQQILIMEYADKPDKTDDDLRKLSALVGAEQAKEKAARAKMRADRVIQDRNEAKSKARNKKIFDTGAMLMGAGLVDSKSADLKVDRDELYGAFLELARIFKSSNPEDIACRKSWGLSVRPEPEPEPEKQSEHQHESDEFDQLAQPTRQC